jgi:hypothetical protein
MHVHYPRVPPLTSYLHDELLLEYDKILSRKKRKKQVSEELDQLEEQQEEQQTDRDIGGKLATGGAKWNSGPPRKIRGNVFTGDDWMSVHLKPTAEEIESDQEHWKQHLEHRAKQSRKSDQCQSPRVVELDEVIRAISDPTLMSRENPKMISFHGKQSMFR